MSSFEPGLDEKPSGSIWWKSRHKGGEGSPTNITMLGSDQRSSTLQPLLQMPIQSYVVNKMELAKRTEATIKMTTQLASFVPDYVLNNDFPKITYDTTIDAVAVICDVSGFTALTEVYSLRGKGGTEQLTKTLSSYISPLAECILKAGGDIIKYAGDAILAVWRVHDSQWDKDIHRVADCALYIQETYGSFFCADVDITIRVKIGIGAGTAYQCVVGNSDYHHFVTFGPGVAAASAAEHCCEKGDVILSPSAWTYCNPTIFNFTVRDDDFVKITEIINFPPGEPRGRPTDEKGRPGRVKELRPSVPAAIERKSDQQLRPYVIPPVHKILDANMPLDYLNESRQTSICFIKIDLKPIDPKASFVDTMLGIVQKAFRHIFDTAILTGGSLTKIIMFDKGLTYLVAFGLPGYLHSNQSANALEFSHRVKGQILNIKGVMEVSLGVTTGTSYCGILGHPKRQEYTVMGQMVNKAARLMCNYIGCVSCDQDTLFHSKRPAHQFTILPKKVLKGISASGNIYEYLGVEIGEDQTVKVSDYPMINREAELKFFKAILESCTWEFSRFVQAHRMQGGDYDHRLTKDVYATGLWMLIIEGDVGIGKSRLLSAYIQESEGVEEIVTFSITMTNILREPMTAVRSLLYQACDLEGLVTTQEKEEHLRQAAGDDADLLSGLCLLNETLHLKFPMHPKYQTVNMATRHIYAQHVISSLLRRIWTEKLILLVIDDGHLMDPQSWDYLFFLSHSPHVVVTVGILRTPSGSPKLDPAVMNIIYRQKNVKVLKLIKMDLSYAVALACQMMEVFAIPQELEKILLQKSNGNPAWIDQVLSEMLRTGLLRVVPYDLKDATRRKLKLTSVNPKYIRRIENVGTKLSQRRVGRSWHSASEQLRVSESYDSINFPSRQRLDRQISRRIQTVAAKPETRMCIVKSETNLDSTPIPGTLKEILLDMFDELNSNEQLLLKCASILGSRFGRQMLICLIPLYEVNAQKYENGFKRLMESKVIKCASTPRSHGRREDVGEEGGKGPVDCFCRFTKEELLKLEHQAENEGGTHRFQYLSCKFMQFTKESMLEVVYELMTEDHRKEMHLRAAQYLDTSIIRCRIHGGEETAYQFGFTMKGGGDVGADHEEALRHAAGQGKRRISFYSAVQAVAHRRKSSDGSEMETMGHPELFGDGKKQQKHEAHRTDENRKVYGAAASSKVAGLEFNVLKEIQKLDKHGKRTKPRRRERRMGIWCWPRRNKMAQPAVYSLKIKKLVLDDGNGEEREQELPSNESSAANLLRQQSGSVAEVVVDLRGCTCTNIQAKVCLEMVKHYRQAEKYGKCLVNLLDAGECAVTIGNSGQALIHLEDAEALVLAIQNKELPAPREGDPDDLTIDDEEVGIQVEFLNGLCYFELGIHLKARDYFLRSLKRFAMDIPSQEDKVKVATQTMRLNSRLWQRHAFSCSGCCNPPIDQEMETDPLVTLKLRILTYLQVLYKVERKYDMVLLLSLWQVITAERGSGSYQDMLPAYCTMMETYSLMSEHKKAEAYERIALKLVKRTFTKLGSKVPPLGLFSVATVFSTVANARFRRGEVDAATGAAYLSLRIAQTLHDNAIALQIYPRLVLSLIMSLRISEVVEVLQKFWYTAEEEEDWNGISLYWTLCLNLLLYTAYPVEPYSACEHFVSNCDWGADVQLFRLYEVQFNIESSVALWNARFGRWASAQKWMDRAAKSKPKQINYFMVEGQLKLLECELIFVNHYLETKRYQHFAKSRNSAKQHMTSLEANTKRVPVLLPRFYHLMAYYCRIRSRNGEAEKQLRRAETLASAHGNLLEMEWIAHNRIVWADLAIPTIKYFWIEHMENNTLDWHQSSKVPWSNIMFSLPLPMWK